VKGNSGDGMIPTSLKNRIIKEGKKTLNNVQKMLLIQKFPWKEVEQRNKHPGILYSVKIST
jgi:hypothetical protein